MPRILKAWGPAALWAAILFVLSELPGMPSGSDLPLDDKVVHFLLYGVLGAALGWGRKLSGRSVPHWALLAVGWIYGALDEWHQSFVPGRTPDTADFLVDVVGVATGYALFLLLAGRDRDGRSSRPGRPSEDR